MSNKYELTNETKVVCACHRDWARSVYWLCAAGITASTVFIGK